MMTTTGNECGHVLDRDIPNAHCLLTRGHACEHMYRMVPEDGACSCVRSEGVSLHDGHCCFRESDATCHRAEIEALYPNARLDDRDRAILVGRLTALDALVGPRVGDWVVFADGVTRRISHIWEGYEYEGEWHQASVQTSNGGSYYLGNGYVSMSGGLFRGVPLGTLVLTSEMRDASAWFFHHDWHTANNGIDVRVPFRVFRCTESAPL